MPIPGCFVRPARGAQPGGSPLAPAEAHRRGKAARVANVIAWRGAMHSSMQGWLADRIRVPHSNTVTTIAGQCSRCCMWRRLEHAASAKRPPPAAVRQVLALTSCCSGTVHVVMPKPRLPCKKPAGTVPRTIVQWALMRAGCTYRVALVEAQQSNVEGRQRTSRDLSTCRCLTVKAPKQGCASRPHSACLLPCGRGVVAALAEFQGRAVDAVKS